jgi:hypothetical protein
MFVRYTLESGSNLWLEGKATIGDYTCRAGHIEGTARIRNGNNETADSSDSLTQRYGVHVSIPVKSFECGNKAMNRDMFEAMKSDSFPSIEYELVEATLAPDSGLADSVQRLSTMGKLTIAGVTQVLAMSMTIAELSPGRYQIIGNKPLSMKDFRITPPSALWGLIEADDRIVVRFDLIAMRRGL